MTRKIEKNGKYKFDTTARHGENGRLSGFGMECWGLKVWGSLESWVRVRVTGSDGSPRINLIQMDLWVVPFTTVFLVYGVV